MDFINKAIDVISKKSNDVSQKAKDVSEVAKLKNKIMSSENAIKAVYAEIGKYVYENLREDAPEEIAQKMAKIDAAQKEVADCKAKIMKLKGIQKCEQCGKEVAADSAFCPSCGNKMPEPVVDVVDEGNVTEVAEEACECCEEKAEACAEDVCDACAEAVEAVSEACAEAVEEVCEACEEKVEAFTE